MSEHAVGPGSALIRGHKSFRRLPHTDTYPLSNAGGHGAQPTPGRSPKMRLVKLIGKHEIQRARILVLFRGAGAVGLYCAHAADAHGLPAGFLSLCPRGNPSEVSRRARMAHVGPPRHTRRANSWGAYEFASTLSSPSPHLRLTLSGIASCLVERFFCASG
jgi:hypothetical protein